MKSFVRLSHGWTVCLMLLLCVSDLMSDTPSLESPKQTLWDKLKAAEEKQQPVIQGGLNPESKRPWLFFTAELRSAFSGPFWGDKAAAASRSSNPKFADPLPPIRDFHKQLKQAGIELWIVPVPAKVAVYPRQCAPKLPPMPLGTPDPGRTKSRIDQSHADFYKLLGNEGITVIDLTDEFRGPQGDVNNLPRFCLTDSHWSGAGVRLAATTIGGKVKKADWYLTIPKLKFQTEPLSVEITGDLATLFNEKNPPREKLDLTRVFQMVDGKPVSVADDPNSPILLLGDSHTLVFHDPTMYAEGCGLADHLAEQLGFAMDVIGVRGSGANAARLNWRRREDPLIGKKLVIWCFSMREFTENTDGWRAIPIAKR